LNLYRICTKLLTHQQVKRGASPVQERPSTDNQLRTRQVSERLAIRLLSLLRSAGQQTPMIASPRVCGPLENLLTSDVRMLPAEELHQLNGLAIGALASLANRLEGRPPIRPEDWRMLICCLISSRTLAEAITRAGDFYRMLDNRWGRLALSVSGATATIRIEALRQRQTEINFAVDTIGMAALHGLFGWLIGQTLPVSMIHLEYPEAMRSLFEASVLPFPLTMSAERNAIEFPVRYLDYPVRRTTDDCRDPLILSFATDCSNERWQADLGQQAQLIMYRALRDSHRLLSLAELSTRLGLSPATVRRQLGHEGASYSQIKERCRRELGLDLLRGSDLSVEDIAARLAFCDSDAFRRSFRGWIGVSPSVYRKAEIRKTEPAANHSLRAGRRADIQSNSFSD
jgi:AraC-like DNA-binding protein